MIDQAKLLHIKRHLYKVRVFDYLNGDWYIDSKHSNLLPALCNRDNQRKRGLFAVVTYRGEVKK